MNEETCPIACTRVLTIEGVEGELVAEEVWWGEWGFLTTSWTTVAPVGTGS